VTSTGIPKKVLLRIEELVSHYITNRSDFSTFLDQARLAFANSDELAEHVHSFRWRLKDPDHLRDKLHRKYEESGETAVLSINLDNLFRKINDLAGLRILHLHTRQIAPINNIVLNILKEYKYRLVEKPRARTWDNETKCYFKEIGIKTVDSNTLYTSVHYVFEANRKTKMTCELQVRTLAEELCWEVDHKINYPHPTDSISCKEQIKVLARITSSCSRLVDAIFRTYDDHIDSRSHQSMSEAKTRRKSTSKKHDNFRRIHGEIVTQPHGKI
jgi:ppGpp synthetase/RelA/SpoT-type nucleotidyltranferase